MSYQKRGNVEKFAFLTNVEMWTVIPQHMPSRSVRLSQASWWKTASITLSFNQSVSLELVIYRIFETSSIKKLEYV